jgi:hypothetical protein
MTPMKRRRLLAIAGMTLAIWLFGVRGNTYAQGHTWVGAGLAQMIEEARWRFGVLRINAAFTLANAGYDSDIYYGYLPEPAPDFTLAASIPVQVLLPVSKKVVLEFSDSPQYVFYLDAGKERAWNNAFRGQLHIAMNRIYFQAGVGLSNVRERSSSPELNINVRLKQDRLNGTLLLQLSQRTSLALIYGGADYDYGDTEVGGVRIAETLNRREHFFDLVPEIQISPGVRLFMDGQFGIYEFAEDVMAYRNARSYGIFGGLNFIASEAGSNRPGGIQGGFGLGYMRLDIKDPEQIDGSGFAGEAHISIGLLEKTTGRIFFSRGHQFSIYSGSTYYIATIYGAGITRLLSRHMSLSYDLFFGHSDYPEDAGGGIPAGVYNRYTTHMLSLRVTLARHLAVTFLGTFGRRVLEEAGPALNRNFIGLNLVYGSAMGTMPTPSGIMAR